jgi:hypothetical protein
MMGAHLFLQICASDEQPIEAKPGPDSAHWLKRASAPVRAPDRSPTRERQNITPSAAGLPGTAVRRK